MFRTVIAARSFLPAVLSLALGCSGSAGEPPSQPAKESVEQPASPASPASPADDDEGEANFASPPPSDPPPAIDPPSSGDPALDARIKEKHGQSCRFARACGDELIGIDCNAAADGPYYYARKADLEPIATCGGACMGGDCSNCPPKEWTCSGDYYEE